jgi:hypothetical protein
MDEIIIRPTLSSPTARSSTASRAVKIKTGVRKPRNRAVVGILRPLRPGNMTSRMMRSKGSELIK